MSIQKLGEDMWRPTPFRNTSLAKARNSLGPSPQLLPPTWWHHVGPDTCATFRCERPWSTDPWVPLGSGPISWANDLQATSDIGGPWFFWRMCFRVFELWLVVVENLKTDNSGCFRNDIEWLWENKLMIKNETFAGTVFHGTWSTEFSAQFFPDLSRGKSTGRSAHLLIFSLDGNACHEKIATCPSSTLGVCSRCT